MTVVYDAGPLITADRNEREMWAYHRRLPEQRRRPITTAPVIAQISRNPRQVMLHRLLDACRVVGFGAEEARSVGALLARSNTSDVVDAHVVTVAERHDALVFTSDGDDIDHLADHAVVTVRRRQLRKPSTCSSFDGDRGEFCQNCDGRTAFDDRMHDTWPTDTPSTSTSKTRGSPDPLIVRCRRG